MTQRVIAIVITACLASACAGSGDKGGGGGTPVVLRLANPYANLTYLPAVEYFVDRVDEVSGGLLSIEPVHEWGGFAIDAETQVLRAVADGEVDLGWSGTRALSTVGVDDFEALHAPMLIDSYAVANAVVTSDVPEGMMQGLEAANLTGLGVFVDSMRKPVSVEGPLLSPEDFAGIGFGLLGSETQEAAIEALGATPSIVFGPTRDAALENGDIQGFELNLLTYELNALAAQAPYITANVNLWPQMDIIVVDPAVFDELSDEQRDWLEEAAGDAASRSAELSNVDASLVDAICGSGGRFANASASDVEAFHAAFAPVFDALAQDERTRAFIERIQALKASTTREPPLAFPEDCTGAAPAPVAPGEGDPAAAVALNGTYRWTLTEQDALESPIAEHEDLSVFPITFTMVLDDATWSLTWIQADGLRGVESQRESFSVDGDEISLDWGGDKLPFTFSVDRYGNIALDPLGSTPAGDAFVMATREWTRIA